MAERAEKEVSGKTIMSKAKDVLPFIRVFPARYGGIGHGLHPKTGKLLCGKSFAFSIDWESGLTQFDCIACVRLARKLMTEGITAEKQGGTPTTTFSYQLIPPTMGCER